MRMCTKIYEGITDESRIDVSFKTEFKGEIWEKWGATYGRNGWAGDPLEDGDEDVVEVLLEPLHKQNGNAHKHACFRHVGV